MSEHPKCRNTTYDHRCHPLHAKKYDGYCLDCENAGVPALLARIAELEAEVAECRRLLWEAQS